MDQGGPGLSNQAFVLDNSVVVAWALGEDNQPAEDVIDLLIQNEARVPMVWPLEFANVLVVAERRKRLTQADVARVREIVLSLPIHVVPDTQTRILTTVMGLARSQGLSAYDATYLDLAMREGLPLATLDKQLQEAARRCQVKLLIDDSAPAA